MKKEILEAEGILNCVKRNVLQANGTPENEIVNLRSNILCSEHNGRIFILINKNNYFVWKAVAENIIQHFWVTYRINHYQFNLVLALIYSKIIFFVEYKHFQAFLFQNYKFTYFPDLNKYCNNLVPKI